MDNTSGWWKHIRLSAYMRVTENWNAHMNGIAAIDKLFKPGTSVAICQCKMKYLVSLYDEKHKICLIALCFQRCQYM